MEEREVKQFIIVRTNLGMSAGKTAAQAAHAAMKVFFDKMFKENATTDDKKYVAKYSFFATEEEVQWIDGMFTKIAKKVKNETQLMKAYNKAVELGLNVSLIKDAGRTELDGENYTAIAVGPNYVDECEPVVKRLQNLTNIKDI